MFIAQVLSLQFLFDHASDAQFEELPVHFLSLLPSQAKDLRHTT